MVVPAWGCRDQDADPSHCHRNRCHCWKASDTLPKRRISRRRILGCEISVPTPLVFQIRNFSKSLCNRTITTLTLQPGHSLGTNPATSLDLHHQVNRVIILIPLAVLLDSGFLLLLTGIVLGGTIRDLQNSFIWKIIWPVFAASLNWERIDELLASS